MHLLRSVALLASLPAAIRALPPPQNADGEAAILTIESKPSTTPGAAAATSNVAAAVPTDGSTIFNGVRVPPLEELTAENFADRIKSGYWFIKHYSPYCHYCQAIAPIWQTLYEFYFTSNPTSSSQSSFTDYYDFHFGSLDCIAYGDLCKANGVEVFPQFFLFQDGQKIKKYDRPRKNMEMLSGFVEEALEAIKPNTRPTAPLLLPLSKATEAPTTAADGSATAEGVSIHRSSSTSEDNGHGSENQDSSTGKGSAASSKSSTKSSKSSKSKVQPDVTPNEAGISVDLTPEKYQRMVTTSQAPWFVKFYAPWCHHCQAMAPNWEQMARQMQGKLNIGEVNCDIHKRLCKEAHIRAFPTIHFIRGAEHVEYDGLRGLGDLMNFATKALDIGSGVENVDAATFKELEETEEVIFVYFYDHATTSEDFEALDRLTLSLIGHAKLVKTDSKILAERFKIHTWPRLLVSRDGRPSYYNALAPKDMRDVGQVLGWMQSVWLPLVPELTVMNAREIMNGRYVVLGILSRDRSDDFLLDKREIKNAAIEWMDRETNAFRLERQELRDSKQLRIEEAEDRNDQRALRAAKSRQITISEHDRKQVGFAWVDGLYWERWLRTQYGIDVKDGEKVVINDQDNRRYWDTTVSGASIVPSRTSILETLQKITADPPKIAPKYTTNKVEQLYFQAKGASRSHPFITLIVVIPAILVGLFLVSRYVRRNGRGGYVQLGEGLLGTTNAGKVD